MPITSLSSREFNQDVGRAKKAAQKGPVIITDRGRPSHVLLTMEEYQRLAQPGRKLTERLAMAGLAGIELECENATIGIKEADFS